MQDQQNPSTVRTVLRVLSFRATQGELENLDYQHLAFGLVATWVVGMGRYWDSPHASFSQHMGIGSLIYVAALALFVWLVGHPLAGPGWSLRRLLTFITLTSPPAVLYAIPVERLFDLPTSQSLNLGFLGLVAAWRVALLVSYLGTLGTFRWYGVGLLTLLPITAIAASVTALDLQHVVLSAMAGLQEPSTSSTLQIEVWIDGLGMLSYFAFGILLIAYSGMAMVPRLAKMQARSSYNFSWKPKMTALALMAVLPVTTSCGTDGKSDRSVVQDRFFSTDYNSARLRFREAVERGGARLSALDLHAKGPAGEDLTIDIAWFGAEEPRRVLLHSSGIHGVEAFAGSAIQLQWLAKGISPPKDTAVVLVHVVNPYGMAGLRRFNESNVDLNRNFIPPDTPYEGAPEGFEQLDSFLNPSTPPSSDFYYLRAGWLILRYGMSSLKQTIAGGQYENPKGLFFGGKSLEQGPRKLQQFVANRLVDVEHLVVIDVHTGLGPFGVDTLLVHAADEGSRLYQTMQEAFGDRVASLDPDRSVAYRINGAYDTMYLRVLPKTDVHFVCQEFGTYNSVEALRSLRAENRWHHHGKGSVDHPSKRELKEAFNPDDESWRRDVLHRGAEVIEKGLELAFAE